MHAVKAQYDGKKVILPKVGKFPTGAVIVIFEDTDGVKDKDRKAWQGLSVQGLSAAYGEKEPDYSLSLIKESNEEYQPLKKAT